MWARTVLMPATSDSLVTDKLREGSLCSPVAILLGNLGALIGWDPDNTLWSVLGRTEYLETVLLGALAFHADNVLNDKQVRRRDQQARRPWLSTPPSGGHGI